MGSDEEKAAVLVEIGALSRPDEKLLDAYFAAVNSVGSEDERHKILSAVLKRPGLTKEMVIRVVEAASQINSDDVKAEILTQVLDSPAGDDPQVRAALKKALNSIQSDGEYRRIMSAYTKH
jgi:hypothetical protein